jgi:uncharacterized membrane protein YfcA
MEETLPLAVVFAALAGAGALAGLMAGLLGIGGGVVMVPALYYVGGVIGVADVHRMHLAVGTSLAIIVGTSVVSSIAHWRRGAVDSTILRTYGPGVLAGVAIGTVIAAWVAGTVLTVVFAVCALMVSANMLRGDGFRTLGPNMPGAAGSASLGLTTGVVSTMAGIGGGAMTVAILTLYSVRIHLAVGTAAVVGILVSVPATVGFALIGWRVAELPSGSLGYVNLVAFAAMAPLTALMAPLGARLAHRLPARGLARIFALFLGAAALNMLWSLRG